MQPVEPVSETRLLLDTFCTITIHGDVDSAQLLDKAFEMIEEYEALFSMTLEGSDVWRINHFEYEEVTVDPRTIEVIKAGLEFGNLSEGMLDITIGRLTHIWRQASVGDGSLDALFEVCQGDGSPDTRIQIDGDTVRLLNPFTWLDLGAIAKGYIGDKVAEFLVESGVSGALINLGGDVVAIGNRHDGNPWRVALRKPFGEENEWLGVIAVSDASVIASGTYERQFEIDGVMYHHILDPFTRMSVISDVVSATVVAENALTGEGLSTIAVLMGSKRAREMYDRFDGIIGMVLVLEDGELIEFGDTGLMINEK
jgi:thiamine biosynthesis lipoprotein